jgi:hypothetical protein
MITHPLRRSKFPKDFTPNAANLEVRMAASIEEAIRRRKEKQDAMMKDGRKDESAGENDQTEEQVTGGPVTVAASLTQSRTVSHCQEADEALERDIIENYQVYLQRGKAQAGKARKRKGPTEAQLAHDGLEIR